MDTQVHSPIRSRQARNADPEAVELLHLISEGDARAVDLLYDRFAAEVRGVAMRVTRDPGMADDVVQETFLAIWRNARQYREALAAPRTWILTIARYRALDQVRRRGRTPTDELVPDAPDLPRVPDVWGEVLSRLDRAAIRSAVQSLPAVQRQAIELAYFSGMTQHEIATATKAPLGTVKSRVRLGLLALRSHLMVSEAAFEPRQADERQGMAPKLTMSHAA
jgi:RNA polymerase sigma-70 factor (ECF subfamily)